MVPRWTSLCTWPFLSPATRGHIVSETLSVCVLAALPSQGELGGRKPSPPEPDPALEPAEPDASRAEHGEQGAVPRGAEAVHVRAVGDIRPATHWPPGGRGTGHLTSIPFSWFSLVGWFWISAGGRGWLLFAFQRQKLLNLLFELRSLLKLRQC